MLQKKRRICDWIQWFLHENYRGGCKAGSFAATISFFHLAHTLSLQMVIYLILALALPPMLEFLFVLRILRWVQRMDTWPQLFVDILWTCPWFGGWNMKIATFWHDHWSEGFFYHNENCCLDQWGHCIAFSLPNLCSWRQIRCRLVGVFDNMVDLSLLAFL